MSARVCLSTRTRVCVHAFRVDTEQSCYIYPLFPDWLSEFVASPSHGTLASAARAPKGKVCGLMNVFQNGNHKEERRALDAARREAAVIAKRELRRPRRWCGGAAVHPQVGFLAFFFLSKVMKTVHSFNIEHNTDRMKMHRYPCLTAMLVTSHHSRSCD